MKDPAPSGRIAVEALGKGPRAGRVTGARVVDEVPIGLPSSGLTHLATGEILIVHDKLGIFQATADGKVRLLVDREGLEGITCDAAGERVFVVAEDEGRLYEYQVRRAGGRIALKAVGEARKLPRIGKKKNSGWEGVAFLARGRGSSERLVCVHEGKPRRVGVYALPRLEGDEHRLPKSARKLLPDVAGVTVEPKSGHLLVVSDQSRTIVEMALTEEGLEAVASLALPLGPDEKPEGLSFDHRGRLWVCLDYEKHDDTREGKALVVALERSGSGARRRVSARRSRS